MKGVDHRRTGGPSFRPTGRRRAVAQQLPSCLLRQPRGQTLLEFALVAPLLLFFLLALVDFGIAIDRRLVLDHAVREGARFASVGGDALATGLPATEQDVKDYVAAQSQGIANASAANGANGSIRVCDDGAGGVQVNITYTHDFVTGFTSIFATGVGSISMNAGATARVEQSVSGIPACS